MKHKEHIISKKNFCDERRIRRFSQDDDVIEIVDRVKDADIPKEVREKLEAEIKKLTKMQPFS